MALEAIIIEKQDRPVKNYAVSTIFKIYHQDIEVHRGLLLLFPHFMIVKRTRVKFWAF